MSQHVRDILCNLVRQHGRRLADDPRRCEGFLRDLCPADKREVNLLVGAIKEGIPAELQRPPAAGAVERAAAKLEQNLGMAPNAARWAAESWALALGIAVTSPPPSPPSPAAVPGERYAARPAAVPTPPLPPTNPAGESGSAGIGPLIIGLLLLCGTVALGVSEYDGAQNNKDKMRQWYGAIGGGVLLGLTFAGFGLHRIMTGKWNHPGGGRGNSPGNDTW